jgi:hypothetical protein
MSTVKVISTGRSPHLPKGVVIVVSVPDAQVLVDKGAAYYEGEEPKEKAEVSHTPKKDAEGEPSAKKTRKK